MEIQPISSCNSETKKRNRCARTISNKVKEPELMVVVCMCVGAGLSLCNQVKAVTNLSI